MGKVKWWLLRPSNLLLWEYGSTSGFKEERNDGCFVRATYCGEGGALWFDCSLVITIAAQRPGWIFPYSCALNIAAWQVEPDEGCPTCRRNEVELFLALPAILQYLFICTHNFNEIVLWWYEGFNLEFMCPLASRLSRYNIPSNTNETTMAAKASQWFADQHQYSHHNWRQSCENEGVQIKKNI